jgi:hypothetical protein
LGSPYFSVLPSAKTSRSLPAPRAPAKDIRPRWLGERFPRLLYQTRYRVECFVDLGCGEKATASARNWGTGQLFLPSGR